MDGKITSSGNLEIKRAGAFVACYCPFMFESAECGHWCPKFGEISYSSQYEDNRLEICHGQTLNFDTFTDER